MAVPEAVLVQFVSPDDEHSVLEKCRELEIEINTQKRICASRWSITKNYVIACFCSNSYPACHVHAPVVNEK